MKKNDKKPTLRDSLTKSLLSMVRSIPIILTVVLLISLLKTWVPPKAIVGLFGLSPVTDTFIGALFGSVLAGNSINSYIIGSQLLADGAPLCAVTAFLATWVIVGIAQLPAESAELGPRFALYRTAVGFLFSIVIALIVSIILRGGLP